MSKRKQIPMREYSWWCATTNLEQRYSAINQQVGTTHLLHEGLYREKDVYELRCCVKLWIKDCEQAASLEQYLRATTYDV